MNRPGASSILNAAALLALFVAGLVANVRLAGSSPIVWDDTFNDETEVRQCLVQSSCTLTGMSTSVPGQVHAVAWLELRTLLAWLGVGLDGAHLLIQVLNALAVVLVFHLAAQLGGPLAGAAAAWLFIDRIDALVRVTALHNSNLLLFLGAVLVLACTAVVYRPGLVAVALAALVAAVMANVHIACVMTGASVIWVALAAPRRRWLLAAWGAALFALATYAIAPLTWQRNLDSLLGGSASGHPVVLSVPYGLTVMQWAAFATAAWAVSFIIRTPAPAEYRRRSQGAIAVIIPFLAAFVLAPWAGVSPDAKYLFHLKAAVAIGAALPLALVARALLRRLSSRWLLRPIERVVPFAAALVMALPGALGLRAQGSGAGDERTPTVDDLQTVAGILRDQHGWDVSRMFERLKTPNTVAVLGGLRHLMAAAGEAPPVGPDLGGSALLLVVEAADLPDPLPPGWTVLRRAGRVATVLVVLRSRLDWSALEVCLRPDGDPKRHCEKSGWRTDDTRIFVPNMPPARQGWRGTIEVWVPLGPATPGFTQQIFMPRAWSLCGGRIASSGSSAMQVDGDGRRASITAPADDPGVALLELEWHVGAPECDAFAYDGLLPFLVEGDAANAGLVEAILRRREG